MLLHCSVLSHLMCGCCACMALCVVKLASSSLAQFLH